MPIGSNFMQTVPLMAQPSLDSMTGLQPSALPPVNNAAPQQRNFWQRIGDVLKQPGMAAALLRSGAVTMQDGLGAGIMAGADYMDKRHARDASANQWGQEFGLKQQEVKQTGSHLQNADQADLLRATTGVGALEEQTRSNRAREGIDANGQRVQLYGIDTGATTQRRGQDLDTATTIAGQGVTERGNIRSTEAAKYGADADLFGKLSPAGIGSKAVPVVTTKTKTPPTTQGGFLGFGGTKVPATETSVTIPYLPGQAPSTPGTIAPPPGAVAALKANPGLRADFDRKFGAGSSLQYLGGR